MAHTQVLDGGEGLQIWRGGPPDMEDGCDKQSQTDDMGQHWAQKLKFPHRKKPRGCKVLHKVSE
jgi:hypothetical protein